jgi:hypothetical protein
MEDQRGEISIAGVHQYFREPLTSLAGSSRNAGWSYHCINDSIGLPRSGVWRAVQLKTLMAEGIATRKLKAEKTSPA